MMNGFACDLVSSTKKPSYLCFIVLAAYYSRFRHRYNCLSYLCVLHICSLVAKRTQSQIRLNVIKLTMTFSLVHSSLSAESFCNRNSSNLLHTRSLTATALHIFHCVYHKSHADYELNYEFFFFSRKEKLKLNLCVWFGFVLHSYFAVCICCGLRRPKNGDSNAKQ